MTRSEIRQFIEDGVKLHVPTLHFATGELTYFNSNRTNRYPCVFFESINPINGSDPVIGSPIDQATIRLHICEPDKLDSVPGQYEPILDRCDLIAQKLIRYYMEEVDGFKLVTITGRQRIPFVKDHADCLSGVILQFTLTAPDKTNLCV